MTQIETLTINNIQYYKANDVYEKNTAFFYGCANNPRNIVAKKNIAPESYLYVKQKDNKWVLSDKSYARAKLLLSKSWVDANVKGIDVTNDNKDIKNDVEMGPPEIKLNDDEYFTGSDGNKLEIKIRGNREKREFYFSVQDVSKAFELPNLTKTIVDNRNDGYQKDAHYKYFSFKNNENDKYTNNKFLYLTYLGILKCALASSSQSTKINQKSIIEWVNNIVYNLNNANRQQFTKYENMNTIGYVYIIDSPLMTDTVKIGFWRSNIDSLYSRYITYYGKDIEIMYFQCDNAPLMECKVFKKFGECNVTQELFVKTHKQEYIEYLTKKCNSVNKYKNIEK